MLLRVVAILSTSLVIGEPHGFYAPSSPPKATRAGDWGAERWSEWFAHRRFALDPWFYFASSDVGGTGCPANVRLSLASVDSQQLRLNLVDDRRSPSIVRATCIVPYIALRRNPVHGRLPDGRILWRLTARVARIHTKRRKSLDSRGRGHQPVRAPP